jgi:hypothetical protein
VTAKLDEVENMVAPDKMLTSGFWSGSDIDTKRSLVSDLLVVKLHKARGRGVAFKASERITIELRDSDARVRIIESDDLRDPEESNKVLPYLVDIVDANGRLVV